MSDVGYIKILGATNSRLERISKDYLLSLNLAEMKTIQKYFQKEKRNPSDVELETIAQTWSEHCIHKTFKSRIEYKEYIKIKNDEVVARRSRSNLEIATSSTHRADFLAMTPKLKIKKREIINNLLKQTIIEATKKLNKSWCVSVFKDNAGISKFTSNYNLAFKVETHNHPSALEPYGGAETGIGGVIRDILGVGLGAKPIFNTDIFCFGPLNLTFEQLPAGTLHPRRIFKGVVSGVRDYGNRMGIPTINGAIFFDKGYVCNPLVFCGTGGLIPADKCEKKVSPGDLIVVIGGRTGRDGIHGATFSSLSLDKGTETSPVQIGHAIAEKKFTDILLEARDRNLYRSITDCGAGGFSSAVGELGKETGAVVHLEKAPLKYQGLLPWEIWVSEAQERMVLVVPPKNLKELLEIFSREDVEATLIGKFTKSKRLQLFYRKKQVCNLKMNFLHKGLPQLKRRALWKPKEFKEPVFAQPQDLTGILKKVLGSPNIASKESVIRQYDHEVQGNTILKPLVGIRNDGPSDASIIKPLLDSKKGVIIANGINPLYGAIDPYWMAASAIEEALRNLIAVGGNLNLVAFLDNFCWGNTNDPKELGALVRAAKACYNFALGYGIPFISGKDSLNNFFMDEKGNPISILPTLLISVMGVIENVEKSISMDLKSAGDLIYTLGATKKELGGSHYYRLFDAVGNTVPKVDVRKSKKLMIALSKAIEKGLVKSCHDCSEGGLGVAAAEMSFAGGLGMELNLRKVPTSDLNPVRGEPLNGVNRDDHILFSESNSRFLIEVGPENRKEFEKSLSGNCLALIGKSTKKKVFRVFGLKGKPIITSDIFSLKKSWQEAIKW